MPVCICVIDEWYSFASVVSCAGERMMAEVVLVWGLALA